MESIPSERMDVDSLTSAEWWALSWSFFWRGVCFTVVSSLAGGVAGGFVGGIAGFMLAVSGRDVTDYETAFGAGGFIIGLLIGLYLLRFYIRWLLKSRLGGFHLSLERVA